MELRTADLKIDRALARELREFAFQKHGTLYGTIKTEAENAIRQYIRGTNK